MGTDHVTTVDDSCGAESPPEATPEDVEAAIRRVEERSADEEDSDDRATG